MKLFISSTITLFLIGCGSNVSEPETINAKYTVWTRSGFAHQMHISYYICDGGFNIEIDTLANFYYYEFEVESSDTLLIAALSNQDAISAAIWINDKKVAEEGPFENPIITYYVP